MRRTIIALFLLTVTSGVIAQDQYKVSLDLINITDDQVAVTIVPPAIEEESVEYHMAKIVPGTYSISDFGRFVTDFSVVNAEGESLPVEQLTTNRWKVDRANEIAKITYKAHDTFDRFEGYGGNVVFEPGGSNIEADRNVFVLNTFGFIGYIDNYKFKPYELTVLHEEEVAGATALEKVGETDTTDVYLAKDFNFLADGPLMYSNPDIATKQLANAEVLVSVFSPNKKLSADDVMLKISDLMEAQAEYLGGELPVKKYAYLIYLMDSPSLSGSMGALEHSYSSVYTLPEANAENIGQTVRDVAAHEFFHIVTPLNIHSEEIGDFNYIEPKMSKHLWLYEGCTEYASMHVQVKHGLYDVDRFLAEVKQKLQVRDQFPTDVPFTVMSEKILEPDYEPMYVNVYYKGALIGMCLDLLLLKESEGTYDLQALMRDLSKKYGPTRSFNDDMLFDEIEKLTYPAVGEFLRTYVSGDEPLPIVEYLSWAGVDYAPFEEVEAFTLGNIGIGVNEDQQLYISDVSDMNSFGKAMGYKEGDIVVSVNGMEVTLATANQVLDAYDDDLKVGDKIKVEILREQNGEQKLKKLKAKAITVTKQNNHLLSLNDEPSDGQMAIRNSWLKAK